MEIFLIPLKKPSPSASNMPDVSGLSVLVPIYNYDARKLVRDLLDQGLHVNIPFEIICFDDGSSIHYKNLNRELQNLQFTTYLELPENIGRSKIRNRLAQHSIYNKLLFIDCDSGIVSKNFLETYINNINEAQILIGGTIYNNHAPDEFSLRWKFGKHREEKTASIRSLNPFESIHINNLLADKKIFQLHQLDEDITTYGHEDTKWGYELKKSNILIKHLDNPVEHCGLETNEIFLEKTKEGIRNFYKLIKEGDGKETKLYKTYIIISSFPFRNLFCFFYNLRKTTILSNLLSNNPSLFYFDLYKLKLLLDEKMKNN